jgi:calcium-translocating P-type ATPase
VLAVVIITNTWLGFRQEYKSEQTMEALRKLSSPTARVIRDGELSVIAAGQMVPGDIVYLEEGDQVAADLRIIESVNLAINEALLTGEPMQVRKHTDFIDGIVPLGDQINMAFKSTVVSFGRGRGIVVATGMETEIGKIAKQVTETTGNSKTPLEIAMNKMMLSMLFIAIILAIIVFWVNGWRFYPQVIMYAIATAVAILPEGLPAVTTVTMSFGVSHMAKEKAIVRRLVSLEALGMVNHICSDKTGTLTEGKMSVVSAWIAERTVEFKGSFHKTGEIIGATLDQLKEFLLISGLCNTCTLTLEDDLFVGTGDSTEIALSIIAERSGYSKSNLLPEKYEFVAEYPFDSSIKRMTVVYREIETGDLLLLTKGALESVLPRCKYQLNAEGERTIISTEFTDFVANEKVKSLAAKGLRVLSLAYRRYKSSDVNPKLISKLSLVESRDSNEKELVFVGLAGIIDPPRPETLSSIQNCYSAGIKVHMITGDHPATAAAIAQQIAILPPDYVEGKSDLVMTSTQFDKLSEDELDKLPNLPLVIARCSPETKVKMIEALHRRGKYVAMTGDGVNDAPAIHHADVGIAMGLGGADVTKQASDVTLTDDNFATIYNAISQGRRIFANIQKFSLHLLSGNVAEVVSLIIGLAFKDGKGESIFPMSPIQILWLNMVTSSPIALALAVEPSSAKLMKVPPRRHGVFTTEFLADTFIYGGFMGVLTLISFLLSSNLQTPVSKIFPVDVNGCNMKYSEECQSVFRARAVAFTNLSMMLLVHGINCRFSRRSFFYYNWSECKTLLFAIVLGFFLIAPLPYIPSVNHTVFHHSPFDFEWGFILASMVLLMFFAEMYKLLKRKCNIFVNASPDELENLPAKAQA